MGVQTGLTHHPSGIALLASINEEPPTAPGDVDVSRLHGRGPEMVRLALRLGWRAKTHPQNGGVVLTTANGLLDKPVKLEVHPVRQWNDRKLATLRNKILRNGVPELVAAYMDEERQNKMRSTTPTTLVSPDEPLTLVSVGPWMVHSAPGKEKMPSKAVLERHWTNGGVDYACPVPGCIYSGEKPAKVMGHYGRMSSESHVAYRKRVGLGRDEVQPSAPESVLPPLPTISIIGEQVATGIVDAPVVTPEPALVDESVPAVGSLTRDEIATAIMALVDRISEGQRARIVELEAELAIKGRELVDVSERLVTLKEVIRDA